MKCVMKEMKGWKILSFIPVLIFFLGILLGTSFNSENSISLSFTIVIYIVFTIVYLIGLHIVKSPLLSYITALSLIFYVATIYPDGFHQSILKPNVKYQLLLRIDEEVKESVNSKYALCKVLGACHNGKVLKTNERVICYFPKNYYPSLEFVTVSKLRSTKTKVNPGEFDYGKYLSYKNCYLQCYIDTNKVFNYNNVKPLLKDKLYIIRKHIAQFYRENISDNNALALLSGLTMGDKSLMDGELRDAFSNSGSMHLLAVSGLHIGIIYGALYLTLYLLGFSFLTRWVRFAIIFSFLWFYAALTGFSPSVLRSVLMLNLIAVGSFSLRNTPLINITAVSALVLMLTNPYCVYDLGFVLSYTALLSIVIIGPLIQKVYEPKNRIMKYIFGLICCSLAVQIGTAPLSLYKFCFMAPFSLLSNIVLIPLAGVILYVFMVTVCVYTIFGIDLLFRLLEWLLKLMNVIIQFVDDRFMTIPCALNLYEALLLMICIILFVIGIYNRQKILSRYCLVGGWLSAIIFIGSLGLHGKTEERGGIWIPYINGGKEVAVVKAVPQEKTLKYKVICSNGVNEARLRRGLKGWFAYRFIDVAKVEFESREFDGVWIVENPNIIIVGARCNWSPYLLISAYSGHDVIFLDKLPYQKKLLWEDARLFSRGSFGYITGMDFFCDGA